MAKPNQLSGNGLLDTAWLGWIYIESAPTRHTGAVPMVMFNSGDLSVVTLQIIWAQNFARYLALEAGRLVRRRGGYC